MTVGGGSRVDSKGTLTMQVPSVPKGCTQIFFFLNSKHIQKSPGNVLLAFFYVRHSAIIVNDYNHNSDSNTCDLFNIFYMPDT